MATFLSGTGNEFPFFLDTPIEQFSDRSAKWLLENTDNLRGMLEILAEELVDSLDFSKIQSVNTTFIPDNLREQESDLVYLLPFRGTDDTGVMIYILIEHQSTVDPTMRFRLLFYMCQIWDSQRRDWEAKKVPKRQWRFRPIIPVLFYTGEQRWQTLPSLETLMNVPAVLERFIPSFETLFLDVKSETDEMLLKTEHPFGWLMTVLKQEHADQEDFVAALQRLGTHLQELNEEEAGRWKQAIYYLYLLIFYRRPIKEQDVLKEVVYEHQRFLNLSEAEEQLMQSMAEHFLQQGIAQGVEQGIAQGVEQGIAQGVEQGIAQGVEQGIAQGVEQGKRETLIESIITVLSGRFPQSDTMSTQTTLEAMPDLEHLRRLLRTATDAPSFEAFLQALHT